MTKLNVLQIVTCGLNVSAGIANLAAQKPLPAVLFLISGIIWGFIAGMSIGENYRA